MIYMIARRLHVNPMPHQARVRLGITLGLGALAAIDQPGACAKGMHYVNCSRVWSRNSKTLRSSTWLRTCPPP
jgi:hypothetical protein